MPCGLAAFLVRHAGPPPIVPPPGHLGTATLALWRWSPRAARILPSLDLRAASCGSPGRPAIEENAIGVWLPITDWIIRPAALETGPRPCRS